MTDLESSSARLLVVGFHGKSVSPDLRALLDRGVGGVILFSRNVGSAEDVAALCADIKHAAARPLVIAVDQEGGQVARLRQGFTPIPSARVIGASDDPSVAHDVGALIGRELRAVGVDMDYAPVLDVDTNASNPVIGARAFSRDAARVSALGVAFAAGLASAGVAACGKHFPGHGDTLQDSHHTLPRLPHALNRLEALELLPFRAAIAAGVPALMTAHVIFEALDAERPATMSRRVVRELLRGSMGYQGLVVSDDIEMRAIADHFGVEELVTHGLEAGVDQFLCCHTAELAHRAIDSIARGARDGTISETSLVEANRRVTEFTARYARTPLVRPELAALRSPAHLELSARLQAHAEETAADPTRG
ncbi:MAG TPA: beta-N-acetylhexosaminidase [Polyangiaceae bacterium]|jgi:beta-N-acetylhexosaminidase